MAYHFTILFPFVSMILRSTRATGHTARSKALTMLLQGLLVFKQASLSGMGRGVAIVYAEKSFRGQLKRAHRLMKNAHIDTWATGAALFAHMTQELQQVSIAVDWTALGAFRVLEACLIVEGRGVPFYSIIVHKDELKHRQTLVELTMWYALIAMRQAGQTLLVTVDRGFAKFDWVGASPLYPFMHLLLRLKRTTLLTWGTIQGPLHAWPLYPGEVVEIDHAALGQDAQVVTAVCLAHLSAPHEPLYVACHPADCPRAVAHYRQRPAVEQQNRDLKSNFLLRKLHLKNTARMERLWIILGLAFYISYCNEAAQETAFVERMSRRYKDGRRDLSWLNRAKCAELCGHVEVLFAPIREQAYNA
jgi:hypothetical protein